MFTLKKLKRFYEAVMISKDFNLLKDLNQTHMIQVLKNNEKNAVKISAYKIIDFDDVNYDNKTKHNLKWLYIPCWVRNEYLNLCCNVNRVLFLWFYSFEVLKNEGDLRFLIVKDKRKRRVIWRKSTFII